jgi:integrase
MLKWGREYQREPLLVFPGLAGVPMTPKALTDRLRRLLRRAGIKDAQPCHGWRHTAATTLIHGGQNLKTVQVRLGHSTPTTTLAIYVHPEEEADLEAAEHWGTCSITRPSAELGPRIRPRTNTRWAKVGANSHP